LIEEYLIDANFFLNKAFELEDDPARRYYRITIFCIFAALESFINSISQTLSSSKLLSDYEMSFLSDKKYELVNDHFEISDQWEYHKCEKKLKFLLKKFNTDFNFETNKCWSIFIELKRKRDELTHPREDFDETDIVIYKRLSIEGLNCIIDIINDLSNKIYKKPLRKKIRELKV